MTAIDSRVRALPLSYVKVGKRARKDLGDLGPLVDSIRAVGLLQPIVTDVNHNLILGERRLAAWRIAKPDQPIEARVVEHLDDALLRLMAERDENVCRKDMTASETHAIGKQIEKLKRPEAAASQANKSGSLDPDSDHPTRKKVADGIGMSEASWTRLKALGDAADAGDELAAQLLQQVDSGAKTLSAAHGEWRERTAVKEQKRPPARSSNGRKWSVSQGRPDLVVAKVVRNLLPIAESVGSIDVGDYRATPEELEGLDRTIKALRQFRRSLAEK